MGKNYYLHKDQKTGEVLYLEYEKIKGYRVTPRTKIEDAIEVNKIVFVNPSLREKLVRKKVEVKLRYFLKMLEKIDDEGADEGDIQRTIMDAERLRISIINHYVHYLGNSYASYAIKKIQLIVNQLRIRLYNMYMQKKVYDFYHNNDLYYLDNDEQMKGRGR